MILIIGVVLYFYAGVIPTYAQDSSGKTAQKLFDMVVGTWTLEKASEGTQAGKTSVLPAGDMHSIEFTREAKYIIRNQASQPYDSGFYRANEEHKLIYLQSAFHPNDQPAEWHVSIKSGAMTLTQQQADKSSRIYLYHRHANSGDTARK